ncbi:MAG: nucleoside hydrolase [Clostridia bacterium]|nr:nucleoside hydrolase [Clostridia bacterium]
MTNEQRIKNLTVPSKKVDVVLDTDAYNEIDDQFAIAYLIKNKEKLNTVKIYAAPFFLKPHNKKSESPKDGMEKSYNEILKVLSLMGENVPVLRGSDAFLSDEKTPVISDAAKDLASLAMKYSPENPLYVVAIGAITNVASAILVNPDICENIVVVWLGGHALHYHDTAEFNMVQDVAAARVVMSSGAPLVILPCAGVVSGFTISKPELEYWFVGKNPLATYLAENAIEEADGYALGKPWTRVIWDVTAVAWLLNDNNCFMRSRKIETPIPSYKCIYNEKNENVCEYVYSIKRDRLMRDLIDKICDN